MSFELIEFNGEVYPSYQSKGFAAKFAFPFANEVLSGYGYDIGCNRKEWAFPGAEPIDPAIEGCGFDAYNLPPLTVDYIFSSHCLEHLADWVGAIDYWQTRIRLGGIMFLYLPHPDQKYWLPWNNRKHVHSLSPVLIEQFLIDRKWSKVFVTHGADANHSFTVIAER